MSALRQLRIVAFLEGMSFLLLLFVAMPLKHLACLASGSLLAPSADQVSRPERDRLTWCSR